MSIPATAEHAARSAGNILRDYFREGVTMRHKGAVDLVSDADVNAERAIVKVIHEQFPDHSILGEEEQSDDVRAEHLWIVDPLDGTTNFAHRIPHFAVSIAYHHNGIAQYGIVLNPIRDDRYVAERGRGATHNGAPIRVGGQTRMNEVLISVGFYYDRGAMMEATLAAVGDCFRQNIHGIRRMGTASLDLAQVATGSFGAYFEYQLSPWDFAAGRLIVEEAGGKVTTCRGEPLPLAKCSLLASNTNLHDDVLRVTRNHHP
ncbi:MAG: inositol monophosphatase family protein [Planctomycetaceae bacterium]